MAMVVAGRRTASSLVHAGAILGACLLSLAIGAAPPPTDPTDLVLWAWERPEDLTFLDPH